MTTPAPDTTTTDQTLTERCATSGEFLAGIIATSMLATHARPDQLPADLFPHIPEAHVTAVWQRALVVGYRAGRFAGAPRFNRDTLARLQGELAAAGYEAMAALAHLAVTAAASVPPSEHPADTEQVRGEHW
jgi:hypothetical protein